MSENGRHEATPRTFRDTAGRPWLVSMTVGGLKRIKALTGEDVGKMSIPELAELVGHPVRLADTLYALCKPEADRMGVDDVAFGESLVGDVMESASAALWGAVADFFPAKGRAMMLALLEKGMAVREKALGLVMGRLEAPLTPAPISSPPASPSPGRSESTPTRERFGS